MTDVPAFLYESFPAASFGGNIAGVVLLEHPASQSWMRGVAADLGAPTTGFVDLPSARQGCAEVRFFTPHQEIERLRARHGRHCHRTCGDRHLGPGQSLRAGSRRLVRSAAAP
jgi:hypothetical protein